MADAEPLTREDLIGAMSKGSKPKTEWRIGAEHEKFGFDMSTLRRPDPPFGFRLGPLRHGGDQVFAGERFGVGHAVLSAPGPEGLRCG